MRCRNSFQEAAVCAGFAAEVVRIQRRDIGNIADVAAAGGEHAARADERRCQSRQKISGDGDLLPARTSSPRARREMASSRETLSHRVRSPSDGLQHRKTGLCLAAATRSNRPRHCVARRKCLASASRHAAPKLSGHYTPLSAAAVLRRFLTLLEGDRYTAARLSE